MGSEEFNLTKSFEIERYKINIQISDTRTQAHCHTTINTIEDDVKEFIRRFAEIIHSQKDTDLDLCIWLEGNLRKLAGDKLI